MNKICIEAWKVKAMEVHSWFPLAGDIGEMKHYRVLEITKHHPEADYANVSNFLDTLDVKEHDKEKEIYKRWAERVANSER